MPITTSASAARSVRREGACGPDAAEVLRPGPSQKGPSPPACEVPTGMPVASANCAQLVFGARVDHTAAGHDDRGACGAPDGLDRGEPAGPSRAAGGGCATREAAGTRAGTSMLFGLDVFGQGDRHRAGLGRVGEHAHCCESDREELLGALRRGRRSARAGGRRRSPGGSWSCGCSICCSTGSETRVAKVSLGSSSAGRRLAVARAAPVSRFAAPGPTEAVGCERRTRRRCMRA